LRVRGKVYELMFLFGIQPEQGAALEGKTPPTHHIGNRAPDDQIQLQLNVMVALEPGRIPGRLYQVEKAVIVLAELEVFEHRDKIR
jgi:hypothetical protein